MNKELLTYLKRRKTYLENKIKNDTDPTYYDKNEISVIKDKIELIKATLNEVK